jgi:RNA polymerase sigma-70 factor (ECF subfamily)
MRASEKVFSAVSLFITRTDEEAMSCVKTNDDHHEFGRLVKRWEEPIRRLCARMTGDIHRGEDLKQETFSRLFERRKQYQPGGRFSTYLWRIALNLCYDELRRRSRRCQFDSTAAADASAIEECAADIPAPDAQVANMEEGEYVRQALLRLPEIYRTVLVLRHYESLKLTEIAEVLDIPKGTVNSRIAEALARMSRMLEPRLAKKSEPARARAPQAKPEVFVL